jgi:hypothetical protein
MSTYTNTNEKEYIISHLIGFSNVTADSPAQAWVRWLNDECMDCGFDKQELRGWLLDNGYKTIQPTQLKNVYLIKNRSK